MNRAPKQKRDYSAITMEEAMQLIGRDSLAKRDDFDRGRSQCLAEMYACQWNNRRRSHEIDVYGIVSNGQGWRFYKLAQGGDVYETDQYGLKGLPDLLGALDYVCAECVRNVP